ncbi:unnamed protein product [Soboliphyme baturini]|uniref:Uncharacterized protein n=1 Tax=Soboliphyme baturini TaxID=241478 RepID=A0A183J2Z4_9BILA|nr:unnamed protein product [Soboliphyme baturini]
MNDLIWIDYFGPFIAFLSFAVVIFILSFTIIFWVCIKHEEQHDVLNKWHGLIPGKRIKKVLAEINGEPRSSENGNYSNNAINEEQTKT